MVYYHPMKMDIRFFCCCAALALAVGANADAVSEAAMNDIRLNGHVAELIGRCIENHVAATDPLYFTRFFHSRQESRWWQSEFWGKWMHAAVPFADYCGSAELKSKVKAGVDDVISTQGTDGYIGNYRPDRRYGAECWDVWGTKYTLLGLLHAYDSSKNPVMLASAEKLADCLMASFAGRDLAKSGWYRGMPSCSVLEPAVWLYKRTGKKEYLDFALYVRDQMDCDDGARLLKDRDLPVFDRVTDDDLHSSLKAYEMMSCYQGLLELYDVTGDVNLLDAAVKTADHIMAEEINIAGGAATGEHWYSGARKETEVYNRQNETCVLTTWMRFCEKLYLETGSTRYLDEIEKCFYNAYFAAMRPDGAVFSQYCPLAGTRCSGENHVRTHTNCCNANGPRGFLVFLRALLAARGRDVYLNFFSSGFVAVKVPATGAAVQFQTYSLYPKGNSLELWYRSEQEGGFTLNLRIPGWCRGWKAKVNGLETKGVKDGYLAITREWRPGDHVEIAFDMPVEPHVKNNHIAFTRGPVLLARDLRFGGDIGEVVRPTFVGDGSGEIGVPDPAALKVSFQPVRSGVPGVWMAFDGVLPTGSHAESPEDGLPTTVRFCDFASAGNTWSPASAYRVWLPLLRFEARR